ncbi:MAG: alpha/beta hydrolase [Planctomycetaceae bacterium]|nr:alpha/beta hydrolase [Planctomycetaceae bacterium]
MAQDAPGFATVEDRTFIAKFDGSEQKYVIMTPHGFAPDQSVSLLIALHGHGSDRWQFVRQPRGECRGARDVAADNKMLLISPDYRAKTSWMGPAAEADVLQIIQTLKQRFEVEHVILCGGSMGGTGALTFTALHPDMINAVVSLNGTANLVEYERFQDAIAKSFGGSKKQVPDEYRKRSAEFFQNRFTMPFAATTGGKDNIVPPASVLRLIGSAREHNPNVLSLHRTDGEHSTSYEEYEESSGVCNRRLRWRRITLCESYPTSSRIGSVRMVSFRTSVCSRPFVLP